MKKILSDWINQQLKNFNTNLYLKSIEKCNYGKYASKDFTIKTRITLEDKDHDLIRFIVPCYFTLGEMKTELKNGCQLFWKFNNHGSLIRDSEITLIRL